MKLDDGSARGVGSPQPRAVGEFMLATTLTGLNTTVLTQTEAKNRFGTDQVLGRVLTLAVSALFLLALLGIEAIHLRGAQAHLQRQLESTAQDAATSIGLALGNTMRDVDPAMAETVVNPVFDRGH